MAGFADTSRGKSWTHEDRIKAFEGEVYWGSKDSDRGEGKIMSTLRQYWRLVQIFAWCVI